MYRSRPTNRSPRSAFTLIELLVVITILVILVSITAASMHWSAQKDRLPQAANDVASFIMGGRDRAIYRRSPTGVRLVLDQNGPTNAAGYPTTVSSMMYIGSPPSFSGTISIEFDPDADAFYTSTQHHLRKLRFWSPGFDGVPGSVGADLDDETPDLPAGTPRIDDTGEFGDDMINPNTTPPPVKDDVRLTADFNEFTRYYNLGLLDTGNQITLSKGGSLGLHFTLVRLNPDPMQANPGPGGFDWFLSADFPSATVTNCMDLNFTIDLRPAILPNQEPRELPKGVSIDLESSRRQGRLPGSWYNTNTQQYSNFMDILYSPRGTGTGEWSGFGLLHLVLTETADVERTQYNDAAYAPGEQPFYEMNKTPEERPNMGQERAVTVNPGTGRASVSALLLDDGDGDNIPDDPFQYAERGKTAK
jgi:prepilin-type N-terminal cleavage/methylation domain-containing protein